METMEEDGIIKIMTKRRSGSKSAEGVALQRLRESVRPESERICDDPYAIHFISPDVLEFIYKNPDLVKAETEQYEKFLPGIFNSLIARVRYFDDIVKESIEKGLEQLVILGAGYDTRAYRIEGLKTIKVFEVDHPDTQSTKLEMLKKIFDSLPDHVVFVSLDFETETLGQRLFNSGFDKSKKTLFIMEGLVMYLPPESVDDILFFIVKNSGKGSTILFDYYPESIVDGTCELELRLNIRKFMTQQGEPLKFGIKEGTVETFLMERGFSRVQNVTAEEYKKMYFYGINKDREVCDLLSFVHAVV